jgi:hypothetical protein
MVYDEVIKREKRRREGVTLDHIGPSKTLGNKNA